MQTLRDEVRYAIRQLRKNPGFSVVVLLTLALSIGANTAIFSVVNALLLRALPYPEPQRLATLMQSITGPHSLSYPANIDRSTWQQLQNNVPATTAAVASSPGGVNLQAAGGAEYVRGQRVSARYFEVLGIRPLLGRGFNAVEDTAGGPNSVVLAYNLFANTFHRDPNIVGQAIRLKGISYTVIGVLPSNAKTPAPVDLFTSLRPETSEEGGGDNFTPILRLKDGATWQQANAQLSRLTSLTARFVASKYPGARVSYTAAPLQQGLAQATRTPTMILMASVGVVLLVACANLAGLALIRVGRREPEIATRLALGATRWSVLRQFWIESLLLTVLGGLAALALANLAQQLILRQLPPDLVPVGGISLDARVLLFTAAAAMAASLACGLLPALSTRRMDPRSASGGTRSIAQSGGVATRSALIVGEVALTVMLLTVAGLLIRTLVYLETLPPGFNPQNVVVAKASLDDARYNTQAAFLKLLQQSTLAMQRVPGVQSAAVGLTVPYERALNYSMKIADGRQAGNEEMTNLAWVTPNYFETLQIPLQAGRTLAESDGADDQMVAVVNTAFARKYLGGGSSVGRHLESDGNKIAIVGEVASVVAPPGLEPGAPMVDEPTVYVPAAQMPTQLVNLSNVWFQPSWIVRTNTGLGSITPRMQQAMASVDPNLPLSGFSSMSGLLSQTLILQHVEVDLLAALAALALLLSAVGIYGLISNLVNQRTRELGIRMALGCTVQGAILEVSQAGIFATVLGLVSGLLLSTVTVKVLRSQLYGVALYDPITLCAVSALLAMVAILATLLPVARIARINPAETLRAQ